MILILFAIVASILANADAQLMGCGPTCVSQPSSFSDACQYCQYACYQCFCIPGSNDALYGNIALCYQSCINFWYTLPTSPTALFVAANNDNPPMPWECSNPTGNATKVCEYPCTCSDPSMVPSCIHACRQALAAYTYATFCNGEPGGNGDLGGRK